MSATIIDGKAYAAGLRARIAGAVRDLGRTGHHARPRRGAGRRGSGKPDLCEEQGAPDRRGRHALLRAHAARLHQRGRAPGSRCPAQRRSGGGRHSRAAAAAAADRCPEGDRGHRSGQGRGRVSPDQCRPADDRRAGLRLLHAAGLPSAHPLGAAAISPASTRWWSGAPTSSASRWRSCSSPRAARSPWPIPRRATCRDVCRRADHSRGRRRAARNGARRLDQAGRHRDRCGHQPGAEPGRGRGQDPGGGRRGLMRKPPRSLAPSRRCRAASAR